MERVRTAVVLLAAVALASGVLARSAHATARPQEYPEVSPFTAVRFGGEDGESVHVEVRGTWYELRAIESVKAEDLVSFSRKNHGARWQKRIGEDLYRLLAEMGKEPPLKVKLELRERESGKTVVLKDVEMTEANRRAIWFTNAAAAGGAAPVPVAVAVDRVARKHATRVPRAYEFLTEPLVLEGGGTLQRSLAEEDLDQLEWEVERRFSYRDRLDVDYRAAFDAVRTSLEDTVTVATFTVQLMKLMGLFGDGHSRVDAPLDALLPAGYLPFLLEPAQGGVAAFRPDRSALVDAEFPYLEALDGIPLSRWLEAAAVISARGSEHFVQRDALRTLRWVNFVRRLLGEEETPTLAVTLRSVDGRTREVEERLADRRPIYGDWPRTESGILDGNLGYLRIPSMDEEPEFAQRLGESMQRFRGTDGLIVDVRGNTGGSRLATVTLLPYFLGSPGEPRVVNVAAYRLEAGDDPSDPEGFLADRWLYPGNWPGWSEAASTAVDKLERRFRPEWKLPKGDFSAWHYFVVEPSTASSVYAYEKPVVVLLDGSCFSATDIFLAAFQGLPRVTLLGVPSGGGSGRARRVKLVHSGLDVRLSSMASFRGDGTLYEGRGVEPDVLLEPQPTDWTGATDSVLQAARERLRGS